MESELDDTNRIAAAVVFSRQWCDVVELERLLPVCRERGLDLIRCLSRGGRLLQVDEAEVRLEVERQLRDCQGDVERCLQAMSLPMGWQQRLGAGAGTIGLFDKTLQVNVESGVDSPAMQLTLRDEHPAARSPSADGTMPIDSASLATSAAAPVKEVVTSNSNEPRFRKISFLARGNLGEVWVAEDRELNRRVALKEIAPRYADQTESRRRFLVEGEITGRLEHPGIVSVYGMGLADDGRPYYAMRLIEGVSLQQSVKEFHEGRSERDRLTGSRAVSFRSLLLRFLQVCEAIDYAHARGIIHRDIKPSNIMLGPFGETLVVDWGLAKAISTNDPDSSIVVEPTSAALGLGPEPSVHQTSPGFDATLFEFNAQQKGAKENPESLGNPAEAQPKPSHPSEPVVSGAGQSNQRVVPELSPAVRTIEGSMVGTPAYMSPEQATGENSLVGTQSDVYSLGATLYQIATGKPPINANDLPSTLAAIRKGQITAPRKIWKAIPKPLEAICLKAMAKDQTDRFASAGELAVELQRFLADEPVRCWRGSVVHRAARWFRHHQAITTSFVVATLVALATLGAAYGIVSASNRSLELAIIGEKAALKKAEAQTKLAQEREVAEALARDAATKAAIAAKKSEEFAVERANAEQLAREEAQRQQKRAERTAEFLVGIFQTADPVGLNGIPFFIPKRIGEKLTVDELLTRGMARIDIDLKDEPLTQAAILSAIGNSQRSLGDFDNARTALERALEIRRAELPAGDRAIAETAHNLAFVLHESGLYDLAEPLYREALEIRRTVDGPDHLETAAIEFNLAWMIGQADDPKEAAELLKHVIQVRSGAGDRRQLAFAQMALAMALIEQGEMARAALPLMQAQTRLAAMEGNQELTNAAVQFCWGMIKPIGAEPNFRAALESVEKSLGEDHIYTGFAHYLLGEHLASEGRYEEALPHFERGWEVARSQVNLRHPKIVFLAQAHGEALTELDRRPEAHLRWNEFLEAQEETFGDASARSALAWYAYGRFCYTRTERATRRDAFRLAIERYERAKQDHLTQDSVKNFEDACYWLGVSLSETNEREEAERYFAKAAALQSERLAESGDFATDDIFLIAERGYNLAQAGRVEEATELVNSYRERCLTARTGTAEDRREAWEEFHRTDAVTDCLAGRFDSALAKSKLIREQINAEDNALFNLASLVASMANLAEQKNQTEVATSIRSYSWELLQEAATAGFNDLERLKRNNNFKPHLTSPELQQIFPGLAESPEP